MSYAEFRDLEGDLRRFQFRLGIAGAVVVGAFALLGLRFIYLQLVQHDYYRTKAEDNRISVVPLVPNRGLILDRNGVVLARNESQYTLEINPQKAGNVESVIGELAKVIDDPAPGPQPVPEAPLGDQGRREPADQDPAHRRRGRALRGERLPLPRRGDQGTAVPLLPDGRGRFARARLHRAHQRQGHRAARGGRRAGELQGLRFHRQGRDRGELRTRAAWDDRLGAGRDRRERTRDPHPRVHPADLGQQPRAHAGHQAPGGRRARVRQFPRRAGRDRAGDRGRARARLQAGVRPEPLRRRHRRGGLGSAQQRSRQAAQQPRPDRRLPARLDVQAVHGDDGARARAPHARVHDLGPGLLHPAGRRPPLARLEGRRPRHGEPAPLDRDLVRHLLLRGRQRHRHRRAARLSHAVRVRAADRRSTSTASAAGCCRRGNGSASASSRRGAEVVSGRQRLGRHRPGLQPRDAGATRVRDRDPRQRRRRLQAARRAPRDRRAHRRDARSRAAAGAHDQAESEVGGAGEDARWSTSPSPAGPPRARRRAPLTPTAARPAPRR